MLSMVDQHQQEEATTNPEEPQSPVLPAGPTPSPVQGPVTPPPPLVLPQSPPGAPRRPPLQRVSGKHAPRYHRNNGEQGRPVPPLNLNDCEGATAQHHSGEPGTESGRTARRRLYRDSHRQHQQYRHGHQRNDPPPPSPRFISPKTPCPTALEAFSMTFYSLRNVIWRIILEHQAGGSTECFVALPLSLLRAGVLRLFIQKGYRVMPMHTIKTTYQYTMPMIMYRIGWDFAV